jgi:hypothetical protein
MPGADREAEIDFVAGNFGFTLRHGQQQRHMDHGFMVLPNREKRA